MAIKINALDHLVVNVTDAEKSAAWYEQALGMTRHGARGKLNSVYCRDPDGSLIEIASYKNSPAFSAFAGHRPEMNRK